MIHKIEDKKQFEEALRRLDHLLDGPLSDEEQDELDQLTDLVEAYEVYDSGVQRMHGYSKTML